MRAPRQGRQRNQSWGGLTFYNWDAAEGSSQKSGPELIQHANTTAGSHRINQNRLFSVRFPAPTTTHSGCTQNFTGVWNQTSRTESSPDCTSLNLDRRAERCTYWGSRAVGSQEVRSTGARAPRQEVGVGSYHFLPLGAPFLQRPEDCHLDPTLCSTSYAGKLQNVCLIQSFQRSLKNPSPKHRIRICQFPKAIYERFWKKAESKELGEKEEKRKSDLTLSKGGKKKTHKAFPFIPFVPPMCVIYLVTKPWMLIECIKGIITQSRELFCHIFKLPCARLPTAEQEQVKDLSEIKNKGTREGEQAPTWAFRGSHGEKGNCLVQGSLVSMQ